jgi:hypothetical protein
VSTIDSSDRFYIQKSSNSVYKQVVIDLTNTAHKKA